MPPIPESLRKKLEAKDEIDAIESAVEAVGASKRESISDEAKYHIRAKGSEELLRMLEKASQLGRVSRGQVFSDFLEIVICTLSGQQMEERYLKVIKPYVGGEKGKRGIDVLAEAFGSLVSTMEETDADILGEVFTTGITYGENGQFFTPEGVMFRGN